MDKTYVLESVKHGQTYILESVKHGQNICIREC
jgi:hypothetical protein